MLLSKHTQGLSQPTGFTKFKIQAVPLYDIIGTYYLCNIYKKKDTIKHNARKGFVRSFKA